MLIPYQLLEKDTLTRLLEDFVTREGTDNGDETPLAQRLTAARRALEKHQAFIRFDPDSQQCVLCPKHSIPTELLAEFLTQTTDN